MVKEDDLEFMHSTYAAVLRQSPRRTRIMLWAIALFLLLMLIWAYYAPIDELTRGQGKVIPSRQVQVVQNLEGGIVSELLVTEGQLVQKGQVLLRIDDTRFASSFRENRLRYLELLTKAARLQAEAEGLDDFTVPNVVLDEKPELERYEQQLFQTRQRELKSNLDIVRQQINQRKQELAEAKSRQGQLRRSYQLALKELNIIKPLVKEGAVSEVDLLMRERQVNDLKGELDTLTLSIPRIESKIAEAEEKLEEVLFRFQSEARTELNEIAAEIPRLQEASGALEDKVTRTAVRSPVKGTVKQLLINTVDGVVQPGMDLVEIVPIEDELLVEARIRPADIAQLHPGQKAVVKITAYDFAIYGGLDAELTHISADTITNEEDESFYLVRVRTDKNHLGTEQEPLPIIPGMTAQVDIMTGKKTVLEYLMKPINRAREKALTER